MHILLHFLFLCIVAVTVGLIPTNPITAGNNATVCAILTGTARTTTFFVTFSTANGNSANAAMGSYCNYT